MKKYSKVLAITITFALMVSFVPAFTSAAESDDDLPEPVDSSELDYSPSESESIYSDVLVDTAIKPSIGGALQILEVDGKTPMR